MGSNEELEHACRMIHAWHRQTSYLRMHVHSRLPLSLPLSRETTLTPERTQQWRKYSVFRDKGLLSIWRSRHH